MEYLFDEKKNVIPDSKEFRRQEFHPPSLREKQRQRKMVKTEVQYTHDRMQQVEQFFEKIEIEDEGEDCKEMIMMSLIFIIIYFSV